MTVQEEYKKIRTRMEQQVKYGLPTEKPSVTPSATPTEAPESGWKETEDGTKYRTVTVSDVFDENANLGKDKLLTKIERENTLLTGKSYAAGSPAEKKAQERADFANKFLGTQLLEFEKDGKTYYQTPQGEQVGKAEFLRVMQSIGRGVKVGGDGYSRNPSTGYILLTGEGLEGRSEKDKKRMTITYANWVMHPLSPSSEGVKTTPEVFSITTPDGNVTNVPVGESSVNIGGTVYQIDYSSPSAPVIQGAPSGTTLSHLVAVGEVGKQDYVQKYQIDKLEPEAQQILKTQGVEGFNKYQQEKFVESVAGQAGLNYLASLPSITDEQRQAIKLPETITAFTDNPYPQGTKEYYLFDIQKSGEMDIGQFIEKAGGSYQEYAALPQEERQAYIDVKEQEYKEKYGWQPVTTAEGEKIGEQYDISGGKTAEMYQQWKSGNITEQQWLDYIGGQTQRASQTVIPASPIQVENFINRYGGSVSYYSSLVDAEGNPDINARNAYLDKVSNDYFTAQANILSNYNLQPDTEGNYPIYNLTNQDLQDTNLVSALTLMFGKEAVASVREYADAKDTLATLPEVPIYDESGNLTGYDYSKISSEQVTPAVVSAVKLVTPDYDTDTLGVTYVDADVAQDALVDNQGLYLRNLREPDFMGSANDYGMNISSIETGKKYDASVIGLSGLPPNQIVIPRKAVPLSEYIINEAQYKASGIKDIPYQRLYYPTITATEYSRAIEGVGYNYDWLASRGAVIKPTISETVRMLANVDPDTTKELATIDKAKLFGYGFVNTLAIEAAIALPFVASPLATAGLGLVSMAPTAMNWSRMSAGERKTALIVDGLFSVLIFGGPVLRAASYIPRELRSWFGNIGSATLINKVTALNTALKTAEGVSQTTQTHRIVRAATDLKNLLVAAKDNGVQGLDRLIDQVEMIRRNPQVFRGIGDMNLTPELENILKNAEKALAQIEKGTYKPVLMATEGRRAEVASREAVYETAKWDDIVKSYRLRTEEEASRFSAANRERIGLDIKESLAQTSTKPILPNREAELTRLQSWLRSERTGEQYPKLLEEYRQVKTQEIIRRMRSSGSFTPDEVNEIVSKYHYLWDGINNSARQASKSWYEVRFQSAYQDLVSQYADIERISQPAREALMQEARLTAAKEAEQVGQTSKYWLDSRTQTVYRDLVSQYADIEKAGQPAREALMQEARLTAAREASEATESAVALQIESITTKLNQIVNILAGANTLSPNAITFLLINSGLSAMALTVAPLKVSNIVRQASFDLRNQFMDSVGLVDKTVLSQVINEYDESESKINQLQDLAETATINQSSITQEDLTEIIAVPIAEPIGYELAEQIIAQPMGEQITGVPSGEITTPLIISPTEAPIPLIKAQEWEAPSVVEITKIPEEMREAVEEWGVPSPEELSTTYRFNEIGVPDISEISFKELTNLDDIVKKAELNWPTFDKTQYMRMMLMQMAQDAETQEAVSVSDLPFEQRKYIEEELKRKSRQKGRSSLNIPFILPLMLLVDAPLVINGIKTLPNNLKMSLLETLPDTRESEIIREGIETELSPQLIEQIEEAAQDIWEKQLEEIVKGDVITSPSQLEIEIEEIIRKAEETGIVMPETLEDEIRKLLEVPFPIGKTVETPEIVTIPQITPDIQPMAMPQTEGLTKTLTETMVEVLSRTQPSVQALTQSQVQALTEQQIQNLTQSQIQSLTESQIQSLTNTQIQSLTQQQIQALTQTQIQALTQTQIQALTETQIQALTQSQIQVLTQTQIQSLTEQQIQDLTEIQVQSLTQTQIETLTETQIEALTDTQIEAMTETQVEALTETQIKILTETKPDVFNKIIERIKYKPRKPIKLPVLGSGGKKLTKEQLAGAIGWKQGIMYKYIYPPYGQEDIINSRSPIQGIPMKEGIRSAYETIIRTRPGFIPPNITRHMGMMDIKITDADKDGQPEIKFIEREQRKGRGAVAKKKASTPEVFTIKGY